MDVARPRHEATTGARLHAEVTRTRDVAQHQK
jgi:hypothetical protein